jgi:hypothetical protein
MPERPASPATPEPDEPVLRAGTWQPRPRARHARPATDDDPHRLAPEELPWGIPARAAGRDQEVLPPAIVIAPRRGPARALIAAAAALVILVVVVLVLAVGR